VFGGVEIGRGFDIDATMDDMNGTGGGNTSV